MLKLTYLLPILLLVGYGCSHPTVMQKEARRPAVIQYHWESFTTDPALDQAQTQTMQAAVRDMFDYFLQEAGNFEDACLTFNGSRLTVGGQTVTADGSLAATLQTPETASGKGPPLSWQPDSRGEIMTEGNVPLTGYLSGFVVIVRDYRTIRIPLSPDSLVFGWSTQKSDLLTKIRESMERKLDYTAIICR